LFSSVRVPSGFFERARGLIGRKPLADSEAWWFENCAGVHMFGMHYRIDVVFLDASGQVVKLSEGLRPFAFSACAKASSVLELRMGNARVKGIAVGQTLEVKACTTD
jgi:uncharacterized membrane protein (UPF0127 family)